MECKGQEIGAIGWRKSIMNLTGAQCSSASSATGVMWCECVCVCD